MLGNVVNSSKASGYGDYTSLKVNGTRGKSFYYELTPAYTGFSSRFYWRVYVDFNNDGVFSNSEKVVERYNMYSFTGYILVPATVSKGQYRIRIVASADGYQDPCGDFTNGEVEDYTLLVN
jgi:hypothetical protein